MLNLLLLVVVALLVLLLLSVLLKQLWSIYKFHHVQRLFVSADPKTRRMLPSFPLNFGLGQFKDYFLTKDDVFDYTLKMHQEVPEEKREKLITVWMFTSPMIFVAHPEFVKHFMISKAIKYPKSMFGVGLFKPFLGEGLVLSDGEKWRRHRMLINQVFTEQNMAKMISKMVNSSKELVSTWQNSFGKGTSGAFVLNDTQEEISKLTLNVITACAFGTQVNIQEMADAWSGVFNKKFIGVAISMMIHPSLLYLPLPANRAILSSTKRVHSMAMEIIKKRKQELESRRGSSDSSAASEDNVELLNLLLEAQDEHGYMTEQDVMDETLTFLFAGHDTTSSLITWALFMFAQHPEMQQRAQKEIHEVLGTNSSTTQFTNEDLKKLNYLQWFINETLRMYPPVLRVEKYAAEDNLIGDFVIPKGTMVAMDILGLHRNPQVWKNPHVFDPERFSPERLASDLKFPLNYSLVTFSIGARNCVGKPFAQTEGLLVLALLLQRFNVQFPAGFDPNKVRKDMTPVLKLQDLKLSFVPIT